MKRIFVILLSCLCTISFGVIADEVVLSDDGREVRLNDDGSWEFVSEDRYATTSEGERIRLKGDGSWDYVEQDSQWVQAPAVVAREDTVRRGDVRVELSGWRIESARDKRKKNTTLRAQMVLELTIKADDKVPLPVGSQLQVTDSRGRVYPVTDIGAFQTIDEETKRLLVLVDGAPRWFGIKFFRLEISQGALGLDSAVRLSKSKADVMEVEVQALTVL